MDRPFIHRERGFGSTGSFIGIPAVTAWPTRQVGDAWLAMPARRAKGRALSQSIDALSGA